MFVIRERLYAHTVFKKFKHFILRYLIKACYCNFSMKNTLYHTCMYSPLPEDEPSGSKRVEDTINCNISLEKVHFVGIYCIIILQCTVEKT